MKAVFPLGQQQNKELASAKGSVDSMKAVFLLGQQQNKELASAKGSVDMMAVAEVPLSDTMELASAKGSVDMMAVAEVPLSDTMHYDSNVYHRELTKVLKAEYVRLAFHLPPDSGSIWDLLKDLIDGSKSDREEGILTFLEKFFSDMLLERVAKNLVALKESFLGIDYTLGQGNAAVARAIVDGIQEEAVEHGNPLAHFLGQVSEVDDKEMDHNEDWQVSCKGGGERSNERAGVGSSSSANQESTQTNGNTRRLRGQRARDGADGAGNSGEPGGSSGLARGSQFFSTLEESIVLIHLPMFVTPTHEDMNRKVTIQQRSFLFWSEVQNCSSGRRLYDPHTCQPPGTITLYQGTRTSSLASFCVDGILPDGARKNEFSRMPAFYLINSARHAFERPLHHKPGRDVDDHVSVMEFAVDVDVLHGEKPPMGQWACFDIHWFSKPSEDWKRFCIANMANEPQLKALAPKHYHDIVIGPVCKPLDGGKDMGVVTDWLGKRKVSVTQVAFCTPRAWSWLEGCLKRVLQERRDA